MNQTNCRRGQFSPERSPSSYFSVSGCALFVALALIATESLATGGRQFSLSAIDTLPNAPSTYEMRDWRQTATNFDTLAFNTAATGQFLPLVKIDNTPVSPQLQKSFGLAAYVGETRTFGETGEPVHEAVASLAAVLGGTLVGVDKSAGPNNWVAMSREYYVDRNSQFIVLNNPFAASGQSAWYEVYPNILFYSIADRYQDESTLQSALNTVDSRFYSAVNKLTVGGASPNFNYTAYNFKTEQPVYNGTWREPDMGLGMAWLQQAAYFRNKDTNPAQAANYLNAVDWSLSYYQNLSTNPSYEILTPFGAYAAARMNAEHGRNYDVQKFVRWAFDRSNARPTMLMIPGQQWGGQDVGGLMGFTYPNAGPTRGYAFSMNTFATAMPLVPLARYEDRFSRAIGKWMLNAANAARLYYSDEHTAQTQSSEFWTGDPNSSVAYEGLRQHWLDLFDGEELYAAGDPLTYGWGPQTDYSIYGSAMSGVFGSIVKTTNVEKILQLDLLATDFYRDAARATYLYYNPLNTTKAVSIDLAAGSYDLYDAVSNRFLARGASSKAYFNVPADEAVMLVLVPSGGAEVRAGRQLLVDNVVIDYNSTLLPDNLLRNPDVDTAVSVGGTRPASWHYSSQATWSDDEVVSPGHSLELVDSSADAYQEWRSYATAVPEGDDRQLQLRWFWKYDVAPAGEFRARLRLSNNEATSVDLTGAISELNFTVSGENDEFEMFETTIDVPDGVRSFDLTFISGGALSALGSLYIDDISAALVAAQVLLGDYNGNGIVDTADYVVWRNSMGDTGANLAADGNHDNQITQLDYDIWKANFGTTIDTPSSPAQLQSAVPEPAAWFLLAAGALGVAYAVRRRPLRVVACVLAFTVFGVSDQVAVAETIPPAAIDRVASMPNLPEPFEMRDWSQVTHDYIDILCDFNRQGDHLPLVRWYDDRKMVAIPAYIGGPRETEAINYLAAVVSGSLVGIDMRNHCGQDWVALGKNFFSPSEGVYVNRLSARTGKSFWYDIFPNVLFYQVDALYPKDAEREAQARSVAKKWYAACVALGAKTDPPALPDFDHTGLNLATMHPTESGWIEPEAAGGIAWIEYLAWSRFKDPNFRTAADWAIRAMEQRPPDKSPLYEVLLPYGALAAARMNAEEGTNYDVHKILNQCFEPGARPQARPGWGVISARWQECDVHGLVGSATDGDGYAFAMNTYQWAGAIVPLVRYDTRYAHDVGKWMLNLSNASRLFYHNAHDAEHQSSFVWSTAHDPKAAIAYEGIRKWKRGAAVATADVRTSGGGMVQGSYASTHARREVPAEMQVFAEAPDSETPFEHIWEFDLPSAKRRWLVVDAQRIDGGHFGNAFLFSYAPNPAGPYSPACTIAGVNHVPVVEIPEDLQGKFYLKVESSGPPVADQGVDQLAVDTLAITYQTSTTPFAQGDQLVTFIALLEEATMPIVLYRPTSATTDLGLYGSSHVGILGGIVQRTNVEGILQLDLLKTDYRHADAHPTYLYYNPYASTKRVEIEVGPDATDIYDAAAHQFLARNVQGRAEVEIPADTAIVAVLAPAGKQVRRDGKRTLINDVVVSYSP